MKKIELVCVNQKALDHLNVKANSTTISKAMEKVDFSNLLTSTRWINEGLDFTRGYLKNDLISEKHEIMINKYTGLCARPLHGTSQSSSLPGEPFNSAFSNSSTIKKLSNKKDVNSGIEINKFVVLLVFMLLVSFCGSCAFVCPVCPCWAVS
ncbi:hypothetical protein V6N13_048820 [Hibiscus sabdariffa]